MNETIITDTDRLDYLAAVTERIQGLAPGEFRRQLDAQILAERTPPPAPSPWVNLTEEFPLDDVPVMLQDAGGGIGKGAYCSIAGKFYCCEDGIQGLLWSDVHGERAEVTKWRTLK